MLYDYQNYYTFYWTAIWSRRKNRNDVKRKEKEIKKRTGNDRKKGNVRKC